MSLLRRLPRVLEKILDAISPGLGDDVLRHVGLVLDALGIFSPVLAIAGAMAVIVGAVYFDRWQLRRRLPEMQRSGENDLLDEPALEVVPRLSGFRRILKPKKRLVSVRMNPEGVELVRESGASTCYWEDVISWSRTGRASWILSREDSVFALDVPTNHGFSEEVRCRVDQRLAFHMRDRPETNAWKRVERHLPRRILRYMHRLRPRTMEPVDTQVEQSSADS